MNATQGVRFEEVVTVRRIVAVGMMLMVMSLCALGVSTAQGASPSWNTNFKSAVQKAKAANKPLFLVIAKEGCGACDNFERELSKPAAARALKNMVAVRAEADDNPALTAQYGTGTPTIVVFSPDAGYDTPVFTQLGAMSASDVALLASSFEPKKSDNSDVAQAGKSSSKR